MELESTKAQLLAVAQLAVAGPHSESTVCSKFTKLASTERVKQ